MVQITALNIYPVKACRGIPLQHARITPTGFEHDREWLIVRPDGRFVTQRELPQLALIATALSADCLELQVPTGASVAIPLARTGAEVEVTVWGDRCAAFDMGDEPAHVLSAFVGKPLRLVRFDARRRRTSSPAWTQGVDAVTHFADAFAWLTISEASLEDLNQRLPHPLPMNRFRPNIVLGGAQPYAEDRMHELLADGVRLRAVKPCTRCAVTTTNQATGQRDGDEPLRTLRQYRYDAELKGVAFGQNLILIEGAGRELRVGQRLDVTWKEF